MVSKLRRLIADHADLHNADLPPNYLFPDADGHTPDDLSQLTVLVAGPHGTPYADGLWRLHLRIPEDYPASPPKAAFKTRIWHPNVEESTGAVCVDTLKRDWEQKLTLRDILVTISCLLIHPNPDSALNSSAGALLQEDYTEFARQARLMTSIHAPVPNNLKQLVLEAKQRGEDPAMVARVEPEQQPSAQTQETRRTGLIMKPTAAVTSVEIPDENMQSDSEDPMDDYKENDPSLSPEPITTVPPFSRRNDQEKRPLSVISTAPPRDTDVVMYDSSSDGMTSSERNIAANKTNTTSPASSFQEYNTPPGTRQQQPQKVFAHPSSILNSSYEIYEDGQGEPAASPNRRVSRGKENVASSLFSTKTPLSSLSSSPLSLQPPQTASLVMKASPSSQPRAPFGQFHNNLAVATKPLEPTKVTKPPSGSGIRKGSAAVKRKPRIGLRRL